MCCDKVLQVGVQTVLENCQEGITYGVDFALLVRLLRNRRKIRLSYYGRLSL